MNYEEWFFVTVFFVIGTVLLAKWLFPTRSQPRKAGSILFPVAALLWGVGHLLKVMHFPTASSIVMDIGAVLFIVNAFFLPSSEEQLSKTRTSTP